MLKGSTGGWLDNVVKSDDGWVKGRSADLWVWVEMGSVVMESALG